MEEARKRPRRDRLSDLQDCILGHILSFLPAQEAGRATVLSRRWRRAFADVHTISFDHAQIPPAPGADTSSIWSSSSDDDSSSSESDDDNWSPQRRLRDRINEALLIRRCWGAVPAPLRSLRIAMRYLPSPSDSDAVDQWLSCSLRRSLQELFLATPSWAADEDPCGRGCRLLNDDSTDSDSDEDSEDDDYDGRRYVVPEELYSCASMRALHLVSCSLSTSPSTTIDLPSLETLSLSRIRYSGSGEDIQRLITGCPRLADLTLEACSRITDLTVPPNVRFRSLALRCCHNLRLVAVDLSETRTFEYRDVPPDASCFTLVAAPTALASAKIVVCSPATTPGKINFDKLREFLLLFVDTTSLQLQLGWPDPIKYLNQNGIHDFFADFPLFQNLTRLELGSSLKDQRVVQGVPEILQQTPNLTTLSLKLCRPKKTRKATRRAVDRYHRNFAVDVPDASVPCLRERVREMSVEQYKGANVQRMLLKSLLRGALVLESVHVVFANGRHSVLDELMDEIRSWSQNPATRISFS